MSRMRLDLALIVLVIGASAAYFASQADSDEPPAPTARPAPVAPGPVGEPSWGDHPCQVDLRQGQLDLVFQNDGPGDYHLYTGRGFGHFEVVQATPKQIVVAAVYRGCASTVEHNCYHYDVFNVPAGRISTMHLGKAPQTMKNFPPEVPGLYRTARPSDGPGPTVR